MNTKEPTRKKKPVRVIVKMMPPEILIPANLTVACEVNGKMELVNINPGPSRLIKDPSNPHGLSYRDNPATAGGLKDGDDHR